LSSSCACQSVCRHASARVLTKSFPPRVPPALY
jgi:hypothetical protein